MALNDKSKSATDSSNAEVVSSPVKQASGKRSLVRAILMASALSGGFCATMENRADASGKLETGELIAVSKRCHTIETCQDSLETLLKKGVDEKHIGQEFLEKYSSHLNESMDRVVANILEKSKGITESLKSVYKFTPPTWAEELSDPDIEESQLIEIRDAAKGVLKDLEKDPSHWLHQLGVGGTKSLEKLARWSMDLANLKLARLEAFDKFGGWFSEAEEAPRPKDAGRDHHGPLNSGVDGGVPSVNAQNNLQNPDAGEQDAQTNSDAGAQAPLEPEEIADRMVTNGEEFICYASGRKTPEQAAMERFIKLTGLEKEVAEEAFEPEIIETQTDGIRKTKAKMKVKAVEGADAGSDSDGSVTDDSDEMNPDDSSTPSADSGM